MAVEKNERAKVKREKMSARIQRAYRRGYTQGFEDSARTSSGSKFWGTRGYNQGYGDNIKIRKIGKRYNKYKHGN